jgi:uncharacterized membrane protein YkvA (DUF1232 family)
MFQTGKRLYQFLKDVANDERIPQRDKTILLALLALLISPFDIIPDWIPILGQIDDAIIIGLILDYFFNKLGDEILLEHYPWGKKSFMALKKYARMVGWLAPEKLKDKVWAYRAPTTPKNSES